MRSFEYDRYLRHDFLDCHPLDEYPMAQRPKGARHWPKNAPIHRPSAAISFILYVTTTKYRLTWKYSHMIDGMTVCIIVMIFGGFGSFSRFLFCSQQAFELWIARANSVSLLQFIHSTYLLSSQPISRYRSLPSSILGTSSGTSLKS